MDLTWLTEVQIVLSFLAPEQCFAQVIKNDEEDFTQSVELLSAVTGRLLLLITSSH